MQCPQCDKECAHAEGLRRHRQVVHHNLGPKRPKKGGTDAKKRSAIVLSPLLEEVS